MIVTQEERWNLRYQEVVEFINGNKRNPSKYAPEERTLVNWIKQQRKLVNKGELGPGRVEMFERLLSLWERYKRVNQYV